MEYIKKETGIYNFDGQAEVKVAFEGFSEIPYFHDDLKLKAALVLLGTVDYKNFVEADKGELIEQYVQELIDEIEGSLGVELVRSTARY